MQAFSLGSQPSSPRWLFFPGPVGRGFLCVRNALHRGCGAVIGLLLLGLTGCTSVSVDDYAARQPAFEPESFFSGFLTAHGVVKDFRGAAIRHFQADITACWRDGIGTLDEAFVFDDGEHQSRFWTLTPNGDRGYTATAGDVVGPGTANWAGNAFFLEYVLRVALDDGEIDLTIDDRMYRVSDNVVINESAMRKWGLPVGEVLLTLIRHPDTPVTCTPD